MRMRSTVILTALTMLAFAGCLGDEAPPAGQSPLPVDRALGPVPGSLLITGADAPMFAAPIILDDVRAGGEPVIAVLPSGTLLVSAHPGWTHLHPKDPATVATDLVAPANLQSYLWRSTDGGESWQHVDLVDGAPNLPRSAALGVSDPDFTVMEDGTVCMTDLLGLATSSVACSMDDGLTWLPGNPAAAGGPNDRQWLASSGDELYFTANYFVDHHIRASTDYGLTWEDRGDVPCSQDLVTNPHTGHLVVGCTGGVAVSEDGGWSWSEVRRVNESLDVGGARIMAEPAIDSAGTTWIVMTRGERAVLVAGSPDEGLTWPWVHDVTPYFTHFAATNPHGQDFDAAAGNGTFVWPWISAGSQGRLAVTWIGSYDSTSSSQQYGPWYIFTAFFLDADTVAPSVHVATLTPDPMHLQPICQSGTTCQATSVTGDPAGDRRLGDFFETTIDADGYLHGSWSNTAAEPDDVVSHAEYVRQTGGIRLIAEGELGSWMPTQG